MDYADPVQAKIHRERVKRRQAEKRRDEWRKKYRKLQRDRLGVGEYPDVRGRYLRHRLARMAYLERQVHSLRTRCGQLRNEVAALRPLVDEPVSAAALYGENARLLAQLEAQEAQHGEKVECLTRARQRAEAIADEWRSQAQQQQRPPLGSFLGYR